MHVIRLRPNARCDMYAKCMYPNNTVSPVLSVSVCVLFAALLACLLLYFSFETIFNFAHANAYIDLFV